MIRIATKHSILLSCFLFICNVAFEQSSRKPTAQEMAVIQKAITAIDPIIESFADKNWEKEDGGPDQVQDISVQKKPDVVMGVAPFNDYHFRIMNGSDLFNQVIKPLQDKITSLNVADVNQQKEMLAIGEKLKNISDVYVEIFVNLKSLPERSTTNDLHLQGPYFSYKEKMKMIGTDRNIANNYVLAFGKWSKAKWDTNRNESVFAFEHPNGTSYIENIVIRISGSDDRIKQLFKTISWDKINSALTL